VIVGISAKIVSNAVVVAIIASLGDIEVCPDATADRAGSTHGVVGQIN
jgi:hypothetical protein